MKSKTDNQDKWFGLAILIALAVAFLYQSTYSSAPTSDAPSWIRAAKNMDWRLIFVPTHLLPLGLIMLVQNLFGIASVLPVINFANTVLSFLIILNVYRLTKFANLNPFTRLTAAGLFGVSYGLWYFANGELHHFGILFVILIFIKLIQYREQPSIRGVIFIAVLHVLAVLLHQEHAFMLFPIAWMMLYGRFNKNSIKNFTAYFLSALLFGGFSVFLIGVFVNRTMHPAELFRWFFYIYDTGLSKEGYMLLRWHDWFLLRVVKGMLMAISYGSQIVIDILRYPDIRMIPSVVFYTLFSLVAFAGIGFGVFRFCAHFVSLKSSESKAVLSGLIVWFACYKLFFNLTYMPESPEYHISANIPLLIFVSIGLASVSSRFARIGASVTLIGLIFSVNLWASILPWRSHGIEMAKFDRYVTAHFKDTDFFVSMESSLDPVISRYWKPYSLKAMFMLNPPEKVFEVVTGEIDGQLSQGKRVFLYNPIPSTYALKSINFYNPGNRLTEDFFEDFFERIKLRYALIPIFEYSETANSRDYLLNTVSKKDNFWEVKRK